MNKGDKVRFLDSYKYEHNIIPKRSTRHITPEERWILETEGKIISTFYTSVPRIEFKKKGKKKITIYIPTHCLGIGD
jgi:signal peptidase I